jgi:hypothetical protein
MEIDGTVQNGVIVVDDPRRLPEGAKVKIRIESPREAAQEPTLRQRLLALAGTVDDLPPDMARCHDHYIHGAPRREE